MSDKKCDEFKSCRNKAAFTHKYADGTVVPICKKHADRCPTCRPIPKTKTKKAKTKAKQ